MAKYHSLEQYLLSRSSGTTFCIENETHDRDSIRTLERRLVKGLTSFGINMSLFKDGRRYKITEGVEDLFNCYIRLIYPSYIAHPKGEKATIPLEYLIELRNRLVLALYSMGMGEAMVTEEVKNFEAKTGCPPLSIYCKESEFTAETMEYFRGDWNSSLTESEWNQFSNELDFLYRTEWLPELKSRAIAELKCFFKRNNKSFPEDDDSIFLPTRHEKPK